MQHSHTQTDADLRWRGTPFAPRTVPLNTSALWMQWDGAMVVDAYVDAHEELRAIREAVAMADMSPLSKYEVRGPDAQRFLDHLIPRDVTKLAVGQVYYTPWCDEQGKVVNDGLVLRVDETTYQLSADPNWAWLTRHAEGYDVELEDITRKIAILTLQGSKAPAVLQDATGEDWSGLSFSRVAHAQVGDVKIELLRQGFTGEIGYELWVGADDAPALWDAIAAAGAPYGIKPAGAHALDLARLEAGLLIIGYDYTGSGGDHHGAGIVAGEDYTASPYELGLGRLIDLQKGDFIGKAALAAEAAQKGGVKLAGLVCDVDALVDAQRRLGVPPPPLTRVQWYPKPLLHEGRSVGHVSSLAWGASVGRLIGFAHVAAAQAEPGTELTVRWELGGETIDVPATVVELPFLMLRRAAAVA